MALLDDVKATLRLSGTAYNTEITDLISAAQADLELSGVLHDKAVDGTDPLIKRAVTVYAKANFGADNPDMERYQASYEKIKAHLTMSEDYTVEPEAVV